MRIQFSAEDWNKIVKSCVPFCGDDEEHEELHSAYVDACFNKCTVTACNGYIMATFHVSCSMSDQYEETHWRLPRILHKTKGAFVTVSDREKEGFISVLYEDAPPDELEIKEGRVFDWQGIMRSVMSRENDTSIAVNPNKLIAALTPFKDRESQVEPVILFIGGRHQPIYIRKKHHNREIEVVCLPMYSDVESK